MSYSKSRVDTLSLSKSSESWQGIVAMMDQYARMHDNACICDALLLGSLKSAKYTCKFQIHVLQRVAVAVRLEEDLCGKLGEWSLGASRSIAHHLDKRYGPLYRGNATREFAT